ncbi:FACT complex subunit-domain-containing protein [Mrakia frigida]|uniref:chromatin-remodeling protein SPT16 n=1 Tax=Mrakia frigida TaxID=29902 RepID=UPI003FCC1882
MSDIKLDGPLFFSRSKALLKAWKNAASSDENMSFVGVDAIVVLVGDPDEDGVYKKSTALQTWLLGYEFPSTLIVFTKDQITFVCSSSKAKILAQLSAGSPDIPIVILPKGKDPSNHIPNVIKQIGETGEGKRIGVLLKEKHKGKLVDEWTKALGEAEKKLDEVDIAPGLSAVMALKDASELKHIATAARLNTTLMTHYFVEKMASTIEADKKLSHEKASSPSLVESKIGTEDSGPDMKLWSKNKAVADVDFSAVDWIYTPIIQSGGEYDLRATAESSEKNLKAGVILASIGLRVRSYCSNMARTFLIDPAKSQEKNYTFLVEVQTFALSVLKDGAVVKDVVGKIVAYVRENRPELEEHLQKAMGSRTGLEFRDSNFLISGKNAKTLQEGMVINFSTAFQNLVDPKNKEKTYSLLLIDTVKIGKEKAIVLSDGAKGLDDVVFLLNGDEPEEKKPKVKADPSPKKVSGHVVGSKVLRGKTRGEGRTDIDESAQVKMKEHQKELHHSRQERGLEKYNEDGENEGKNDEKKIKKFESYKREDQLPKEVARRRIFVDDARQTIILPINGYATPFHINTIKNVSKNEEGDYTYLRINFQSPGQIAGKKEDTPFEDPNATFIRSAVFRSTDSHHFGNIYEQITKMRTQMTKREKDKKELADVITQDRLIEIKNKRPAILEPVMIKPGLDGKRVAGELQIHDNGIRYSTHSGQKVDLLFSNIKHLFFQPCDHELIVIIHVHLKAPIMIGKKKAKDVQFSREASDVQFDETGNKKRKYRYGDEDEIELEQEERKLRQSLNREFKAFSEKIAAASHHSDPANEFEVDIPFRDLGFQGVPFRTNVLLQPTTDCLVHLTDMPFTVITLNEVEVCHFERVQHGLKQFDLVFVFSDFSRSPLHVNSIPFGMLEGIKEWLDSVDIPISEGAVNLTWSAIMKTVNEDPYAFFVEGGWGFLGGDSDDQGSDESESASEFEADSDVGAASSKGSSSGESDFDEGASDDEGSEEEYSEGESWDELESKAKKSDEKRFVSRRLSFSSNADR